MRAATKASNDESELSRAVTLVGRSTALELALCVGRALFVSALFGAFVFSILFIMGGDAFIAGGATAIAALWIGRNAYLRGREQGRDDGGSEHTIVASKHHVALDGFEMRVSSAVRTGSILHLFGPFRLHALRLRADADLASELVDALEVPEEGIRRVRLSNAVTQNSGLFILIGTLGFTIVPFGLLAGSAATTLAARALLYGVASLGALLLIGLAIPRWLEVKTQGVDVRWLWRRKHFRHAEISGVQLRGRRLTLRFKTGQERAYTIRLRMAPTLALSALRGIRQAEGVIANLAAKSVARVFE